MSISEADCFAKYGPPEKEAGMVLWDVPTELEIGAIPKRIYCNKDMVDPLKRGLGNLIARSLVHDLKTWDGCFNIRASKSNASRLSLHAWGLAFDVNAAWNGFGKPPTLSPAFVAAFTDAGFEWGGHWKRPDGMHFQPRDLPRQETANPALQSVADMPELRAPFRDTLATLVLSRLLPDEPFGRGSRAMEVAVIQFQTLNRLKTDGVVGPVTWRALLSK